VSFSLILPVTIARGVLTIGEMKIGGEKTEVDG
jgi:hypothetical protein